MTNAPQTRKTHVTRILGTNRNGDVLPDIWADVERIDIAKSVTQTVDSPNFQGYQRKFRWMDDPDDGDYDPNGNPARQTEIVKVCDPNGPDVDDPEEWIPIPAIKSLKARNSDIGTQERLHDDPLDSDVTTSRVIENRRIVHYDTNIDVDAQAAFDADPTRTAFVVPGDRYQRDETTKDDSQFVEHEVITYLKHRTNETSRDSAVNRGRQTKLLNQYLIDESDDATLDVVGANGINPPYRLDWCQNIVNVNLGGGGRFVACGQDTSGNILVTNNPAIILFNKMKGKRDDQNTIWSTTDKNYPVIGGSGNVQSFLNASAYGKLPSSLGSTSTFVIGGGGSAFTNSKLNAVIQTSRTGDLWETVYTNPDFFIASMSWDEREQRFYASMIGETGPESPVEVLLRSSDGVTWVEVNRQNNFTTFPFVSLIKPHCNHLDLPSGVYGYDKSKKILIAPDPIPSINFSGATVGTTSRIQIRTKNGTTIKSIPGFDIVKAVGFAGGIWRAVGSAPGDTGTFLISTSIDDGKTWNTAFSIHAGIDSISAGPKSDFAQ